MWVYLRSEPNLYTVGFYGPTGEWHSDSDHSTKFDAGERVAYLNGSAADSKLYDEGYRDGVRGSQNCNARSQNENGGEQPRIRNPLDAISDNGR